MNDDTEHNENVKTVKNNILGNEADAVMLILFAECNEKEEYLKLHEIMGHTNFTAMLLDNDEKKQIIKVHRYFGHRSGRKIWEIFAKAGHLKVLNGEYILWMVDMFSKAIKGRS